MSADQDQDTLTLFAVEVTQAECQPCQGQWPDEVPVLVCHGHHAPKSQVELQDIGVNLARSGSTVLIMDQLGHGERRQHPFRASADHPGPLRLDRLE